jgi:hypothetical protein
MMKKLAFILVLFSVSMTVAQSASAREELFESIDIPIRDRTTAPKIILTQTVEGREACVVTEKVVHGVMRDVELKPVDFAFSRWNIRTYVARIDGFLCLSREYSPKGVYVRTSAPIQLEVPENTLTMNILVPKDTEVQIIEDLKYSRDTH